MRQILVNRRWKLKVPEHRVDAIAWDVWEKERLDSMHKNIREGDVLFDVGAEQGDLSALFGVWGADVVPFEPNPLYFPGIRSIYEANVGRPVLGGWAGFVSNEDVPNPINVESLFVKKNEAGTAWPGCAYAPLVETYDFRNRLERFNDTPQVKLDTFVEDTGLFPDKINIDVEGAELEVLRGGEGILKKYRPVVWVSVHPEMLKHDYGYEEKDLFSFMQRLGFRRRLLGRDHETHYVFWPKEKEIIF